MDRNTPANAPGAGRVPGKLSLTEETRRQLLEEALGLVMAPAQARRVCAGLLRSLDSFRGIFAAQETDLRSVPGMTEPAVRLVRLVVRLAQAYDEEQTWDARYVYDSDSAARALSRRFTGRRTEAVGLLLLDRQGRAVYNDLVCEGSFGEVPLHMRRLVQLCIVYQATEAYVAHNHPSGVIAPSFNDLLLTGRLLGGLEEIGVELSDHLIFGGENYYSFREDGMLERLRRLKDETQSDQLQRLRAMDLHTQEETGLSQRP